MTSQRHHKACDGNTIQRNSHEEFGIKRCVHKIWRDRVRCAKQILAISKAQTPNRLTGAEKVKLLHASMACPQSRQIWCGSMKPRTEQ